jgi:hypothetical protein
LIIHGSSAWWNLEVEQGKTYQFSQPETGKGDVGYVFIPLQALVLDIIGC